MTDRDPVTSALVGVIAPAMGLTVRHDRDPKIVAFDESGTQVGCYSCWHARPAIVCDLLLKRFCEGGGKVRLIYEPGPCAVLSIFKFEYDHKQVHAHADTIADATILAFAKLIGGGWRP